MTHAIGEDHYGKGIALLLLATIGWSLSGIFVRFMPGIDGWQINAWRGLTTAVVLSLYLVAAHGRQTWQHVAAVPPKALAIYALCFTTGSTFYIISLTLTSTATVATIGAINPLLTAIIAFVLIGERPSLATWIAAIVAVGGVGIIFHDGLAGGSTMGVLCAIATTLIFALQLVLLRSYRGYDLTPGIVLGGIVTFAGAGTVAGGLEVPPGTLPWLIGMGVCQLALPGILFVQGARFVPAVTIAIVVLLEAVLNPLWTYLGVGEVPSVETMIGGAIIITAVLLSILAGARTRAPAPVPATDQPR
jgi:drug/metabolite transporter (DMT)-like permease